MQGFDSIYGQIFDCLTDVTRQIADAESILEKILKRMSKNGKSGVFCDLSLTEAHFIAEIAQSGSINGTSLAKRLGLSRGGVSKMASRLVDKGMIKADKMEGNKKELYYTLLEDGEFINKIHGFLHEFARDSMIRALQQYSGEDLKKFVTILCQLSDVMSANSKEFEKNAPNILPTYKLEC